MSQELTETMTAAPFFHGGNAIMLTFLIGLFSLIALVTIASAAVRIRVAKHEAQAQIDVERERTRQAELGAQLDKP